MHDKIDLVIDTDSNKVMLDQLLITTVLKFLVKNPKKNEISWLRLLPTTRLFATILTPFKKKFDSVFSPTIEQLKVFLYKTLEKDTAHSILRYALSKEFKVNQDYCLHPEIVKDLYLFNFRIPPNQNIRINLLHGLIKAVKKKDQEAIEYFLSILTPPLDPEPDELFSDYDPSAHHLALTYPDGLLPPTDLEFASLILSAIKKNDPDFIKFLLNKIPPFIPCPTTFTIAAIDAAERESKAEFEHIIRKMLLPAWATAVTTNLFCENEENGLGDLQGLEHLPFWNIADFGLPKLFITNILNALSQSRNNRWKNSLHQHPIEKLFVNLRSASELTQTHFIIWRFYSYAKNNNFNEEKIELEAKDVIHVIRPAALSALQAWGSQISGKIGHRILRWLYAHPLSCSRLNPIPCQFPPTNLIIDSLKSKFNSKDDIRVFKLFRKFQILLTEVNVESILDTLIEKRHVKSIRFFTEKYGINNDIRTKSIKKAKEGEQTEIVTLLAAAPEIPSAEPLSPSPLPVHLRPAPPAAVSRSARRALNF